ncbi:hypothetical protein TKWG_13140 [Advenella kashmirensis WT001]|uniref:Uncharacterized protein n=1 Tax=Advenella kashmirensis (strain DSM 17095 / LMG 22695 / WT001) TaxID=1036672 RepID=I3UCL6_ADVKW|nr:hypothetical protein [Advenella kashmirensis]AFK62754.1 hypothetical protein TKWG_13140 [Advenella kashmirensis WT001]
MAEPMICAPGVDNYPEWTTFSVARWYFFPKIFGGGATYLHEYKDAWIVYNKNRIRAIAGNYGIPPILLAGIAWEELGGKAVSWKRPVYIARRFDWSGPAWMDENLTITGKPPEQTSFGPISIQLRVVIKELGLNANTLSTAEAHQLITCLETDVYNLQLVAKHLQSLIRYDYPSSNSANLTDEQYIVVGSRYNRGIERKLSDITDSIKSSPGAPNRKYSEYGRVMLRRREHIIGLMK